MSKIDSKNCFLKFHENNTMAKKKKVKAGSSKTTRSQPGSFTNTQSQLVPATNTPPLQSPSQPFDLESFYAWLNDRGWADVVVKLQDRGILWNDILTFDRACLQTAFGPLIGYIIHQKLHNGNISQRKYLLLYSYYYIFEGVSSILFTILTNLCFLFSYSFCHHCHS